MSNALVPVDPKSQAIVGAEIDTAGAVAQARAQVEAQYLVAERRPRSMDAVRQRLLRECERSSFAAVALYRLPRGGKTIEGPSIRFAEAARRIAGNMLASCSTVYDADDHQILRITAVDLETNAIEIDEVTVPKFVERKVVKQGDEVIGTRTNSYGEPVYKIRATDDDFRVKRRAESQRAKRNAILALVPGDIVEECVERIHATRKLGVENDPDAARKQVVDGFAKLNVPADQLERYLGHDLATASPGELMELQAVWVAVRDGECSWHEVLASKTGVADDKDEAGSRVRDKIAAVKDRLQKRRAKPAAESGPGEKAEEPAKAAPAAAKGKKTKVDKELEEIAETAGVSLDEARKLREQGWELHNGELVPPEPGAEG